jgi:LysR family transcriptional regulator, hydrogen peroxide-inducible genes activator
MVEALPSELCRQLTDRRVDVIITALIPGPAGALLVQEDLWEECLLVALPADHRLARRSELSWGDIATLRLHLRTRAGETSLYRNLLAPVAPPLDCEEHDVSGEALLEMVSIGMGATIIAQSARVERSGVVYRPVAGAHGSITFQALWPRCDRSPLRHRLLSHVRKHVRGTQS